VEINQEQLQKLKDTIGSKLWRLNNLYHVRNKEGRIVRFELNESQLEFFNSRHNRNIILKARQKGFTTLAVIDALDDCLFIPNFEAGIIAHSLDDAKKIFDKAKLAFDRLPDWLKKLRTPNTDKAGEYVFPNNSKFSVDTSFRSGTLSRLHVSEFGKISKKYPEKAKEIRTGAFEAIPKEGRIDVESTAEGVGGDFYDLCQEAIDKDQSKITPLEFKFHFHPWWKTQEYRIEADVSFDKELQEYFNYLKNEQGIILDCEQMNWYALKKESLKDEMAQEYPSFPEESFLASGRPFFNQTQIAAEIKRCKSVEVEIKHFAVKDLEGREHSYAVKLFGKPEQLKAYAVAGDPAEGLENGDNSALSVIDKDFNQVAVFAGKVDPDLFGALLVEVAKYYNNALLAWESNNHGHAVENAVKLRRYFNLYRRKTKEKIGEETKDQVGWLNTAKSKMEMLDELKQAFRDDSLTVNDEATLREMMSCVVEEDGNVIVNGKDRVVSLGISIQAIKQAVIQGEFKAFTPGKTASKDVTQMTIEEKMKYYKRMQRA
jgi:hypothetical protein